MADFEIPIEEEKLSIFQKMESAIAENEGKLDGGEDSGSFMIPIAIGKIEGDYEIQDGSIAITVTKKPMIVSRKMIREAIEKFLTGQ